jgi:hypothetical protein
MARSKNASQLLNISRLFLESSESIPAAVENSTDQHNKMESNSIKENNANHHHDSQQQQHS